jgi:hypothetical protein
MWYLETDRSIPKTIPEGNIFSDVEKKGNKCNLTDSMTLKHTFAARTIISEWLLSGHQATHDDFPVISLILVWTVDDDILD